MLKNDRLEHKRFYI